MNKDEIKKEAEHIALICYGEDLDDLRSYEINAVYVLATKKVLKEVEIMMEKQENKLEQRRMACLNTEAKE